jgi:mannitol/fructose-specific phosphotransferase system IIA component
VQETGRINKNKVTLVEYANPVHFSDDRFFIMSGVVGIHASREELNDLYTILNYYLNMDSFTECKIKVGDQDVAIQ